MTRALIPMRFGAVIGIVLILGIVGSTVAIGQPQDPKKQIVIRYQKRSYFDFEDTLIQGKVRRPEGAFVYSRKHASFLTKIQMKRSFMPELKATGSGE